MLWEKEKEREFSYAYREETLKSISRFDITVPEILGKGSRMKAAKSCSVPSPVFTSSAKPSRWKRISRTKAETWKASWRDTGRNCKEPVPSNPRVADATEKLVEINHLCHRQNTIRRLPALGREQPAIASHSPQRTMRSLHSRGLSDEMQFHQPGPCLTFGPWVPASVWRRSQ